MCLQINSGNGGSGIIGKGSNVSSSPDAGGISGSSSGGGGGSISGAGSAGEDGMEVNKGKKRARTESGGASSETGKRHFLPICEIRREVMDKLYCTRYGVTERFAEGEGSAPVRMLWSTIACLEKE